MTKEQYPNDSAVQLMWGAEQKLRRAQQGLEEFTGKRGVAEVQLLRIKNALYLLEEARHVLSDAEDAPDATQEALPF